MAVKESNDLVVFIEALAHKLRSAKEDDGKIDLSDIGQVFGLITPGSEAATGFTQIPGEVLGANGEERDKLLGDLLNACVNLYESLRIAFK